MTDLELNAGRRLARAAALVAIIALGAAPGLAETSPAAEPAQQEAATPDPAAAAFDALKTLDGTWQLAEQPEHGLRIVFSTTARGSVLVEEWTFEGAPHSLTLYHRDGDTLMATHYCPQGNQPRMTLVPGGDGLASLTFRDVTDFDPASEQHQHSLSLALGEDGALIRSEIYRDGEGGDHPSQLVLARVEG
ncbi:hypothetical protein [Henriciella litoralis]|uniref:hypothetical protein n=1 Tax=Henriciella litoralis TaxID=568102 RepID=UPI00111BF432|nr:hypothetical protein [Henriciella litoralis]